MPSATPCPGRWHLMSVMLSAAGSLRWFRDALAPGDGLRRPGRRGRRASRPAATGLRFLPYLTGERSPHADPLARGAFVGLTAGHDRRHLTRAVLEGVAFGLRDGLDLDARGRHAACRRRSGPRAAAPSARSGARSWPTSWARRSPPSTRPRARPTAPGCWPPWGRAGSRPSRRPRRRCVTATPVGDARARRPRYAEAYATYRELYPALAPIFPRLSRRCGPMAARGRS